MRGQALTAQTRLDAMIGVASAPAAIQASIARVMGLPEQTVADQLKRYEPVTSALRVLKRDWLAGMWQVAAVGALDKLVSGLHGDTLSAKDAREWATTAAICTDKLLLIHGQPTSIVAGVHEIRATFPELADRLSGMARRVRVDGKRLDNAGLPDPAISLSGRRPGDEGTEASSIPDREEGR